MENTPEQEAIYVELLMPHDVIVFQVLEERAVKVVVPKRKLSFDKREEIDHVKPMSWIDKS
jgi:hypothetical protein